MTQRHRPRVLATPFAAVASNRTLDPLLALSVRSVPLKVGWRASAGVSVVVMHVALAGATAAGYPTVFSSGEAGPTASNLNFVANQTVSDLVADLSS